MAVIRPQKPLNSSSPLLKKKLANQGIKAKATVEQAQAPVGDQVKLSAPSVEAKIAVATPKTSPEAKAQEFTSETAQAEAAPSTIVQETPSDSAVDDETTNWVLESVASTPYAKDPSMEVVRRRFGTLNKAVRATFTDPLLDAITQTDQEVGSGKLKDLANAANWAQSFKKDAAKLAENGDFAGMIQRAKELSEGGKKTKTLLDGVVGSKSMRFSSELAPSRAKEANQLLKQYENGNDNPGIGSKALGKGISYLRGRKGTRIFFKKQGDETQWLAVCDKSTEPKAIKLLQKEFKLS